MLCVLMITGISCRTLPDIPRSYAAQEKSITLYIEDWTDNTVNKTDYDAAFGFDTLVTPAYATGWNIRWESSNKSIASVDQHGRVLAKKAGTCTITATCTWGSQTATDTISVTVKKGCDPSGTFFFNSTDIDISGADQNLSSTLSDDDPICSGTPEAVKNNDTAESSGTTQIQESLEHDHTEGEMVVVFDKTISSSEIKETIKSHDAGVEEILQLGDDSKAVLAAADSENDLQNIMESLTEEDAVAYVQPNYIYKMNDDSITPITADGTALSLQQYYHKMINTEGAWDLLEKNGISQTSIVGVVDSGVDAAHKYLTDNLILKDGSYRKFSNSFESWARTDSVGHGTHVSGIIGAKYENDSSASGVASGRSNNYCRILPAGVVTGSGRSAQITTIDTVKGINYVVDNGADVVNMSFGSDAKDRAVADVIADNYYSHRVVFVASAGNKESSEISDEKRIGKTRLECMNFPAEMKEVISVCSVIRDGTKNTSSYSGLAKDISAPGTDIYSTYPNDRFTSLSGTSMAAPMVSAAAALILDANPDLTAQEVRNIICATAQTACGDKNDYYISEEAGYGLIDVKACVETAYEAREHARTNTGDSTNSSDGATLGFSIKSYYDGEPEPFVLQQETTTTISKSISKVPSFTAAAARKKIKLTFGRGSLVTTEKEITKKQNYTRHWWEETTTTKTSSTKGVKHQIRVKYGGTTKYFKITGSKNTSSIYVNAGTDSIKVTLRKFGSSRYRTGKTYYVAVRAYKTVNGKIKYGKWSKTIKVKVK